MSMKSYNGFTLIEALIAITILTFAVAGPLSTASRALVAAEIARDQVTASYLAQEGIEYVRAMRDDAYLDAYQRSLGENTSSTAWANFTSGTSAWSIASCEATTCTFDPTRSIMGTGPGLSLEQCSLSGGAYPACGPLYLTGSGIYTEQSGLAGVALTNPSFTRTILATKSSPTDENVTVTVSWSFHGTTYSVDVTDHFTAWQ